MNTRTLSLPKTILLAAATLLIATGCASAEPAAPSAVAKESESLSISDSWVKAADEGMSAAFGLLENNGPTDITVVSATTPASSMIELHETVENDAGEMMMQAKDGGFVIPSGGSYELAPGGNHIMLMGLTAPLKAGDESTFTLTLSDGSVFEFTAPAKDYSGANETYEGDADMEMDMDAETETGTDN